MTHGTRERQITRTGRLGLLGVAAALLLALPLATQPASANGVPTVVELRYLDGLSNWGPNDATGRLELSFAEGYARLEATALPALQGETYQGWLVNSESNDAISVGRFNANASKQVSFNGTLPAIADFGFDLFIITVEPEPDDAPQPTANRSIGGHFALVGPEGADGQLPGDVSTRPGQLPNTGDATLLTDVVRVSLLLAGMALSIVAGMRLGRRHA